MRRVRNEQGDVICGFCIESYKAYRSMTGKQTVDLFRKYGVFDNLAAHTRDFSRELAAIILP